MTDDTGTGKTMIARVAEAMGQASGPLREPTAAMIEAGDGDSLVPPEHTWGVMIDAALEEQPEPAMAIPEEVKDVAVALFSEANDAMKKQSLPGLSTSTH
jgi:hypothetical protein